MSDEVKDLEFGRLNHSGIALLLDTPHEPLITIHAMCKFF